MINEIKPPIQYPPLDLKRCSKEPLWCKKEITKRLILLLLEWTRSRPLPFITHIQPAGSGPPRPPVIPPPAEAIYTVFSNTTDGILMTSGQATWPLARDPATADYVRTVWESYQFAVEAARLVGLYRCHRCWFDFDLSSIPSGLSIVSATLKLRTTGPYSHDICIQEGTHTIPLIDTDFQAFTGNPFATETTSVGLNTIDLNSDGLSYLQTVLGSTAKLCVREYNFDYLDVAPTAVFGRVGLYFAETPSDDDKPTLTITTG